MANGTSSAGFTHALTNIAPGDVNNTYVDLTNGASLIAQNLTLTVMTGTGNTLLTTDASKGLAVVITGCSIVWNTITAGVCSGTSGVLMSSHAVSALGTAVAVSGALVTGAINAVYHLQVSVTLPDQSETL